MSESWSFFSFAIESGGRAALCVWSWGITFSDDDDLALTKYRLNSTSIDCAVLLVCTHCHVSWTSWTWIITNCTQARDHHIAHRSSVDWTEKKILSFVKTVKTLWIPNTIFLYSWKRAEIKKPRASSRGNVFQFPTAQQNFRRWANKIANLDRNNNTSTRMSSIDRTLDLRRRKPETKKFPTRQWCGNLRNMKNVCTLIDIFILFFHIRYNLLHIQ